MMWSMVVVNMSVPRWCRCHVDGAVVTDKGTPEPWCVMRLRLSFICDEVRGSKIKHYSI